MKPVWTARTGAAPSPLLQRLGDSTAEDAAFLPFDIQGSITHVRGLHHAGLINIDEEQALVTALHAIPHDMVLDPALEDVHMNMEAELTNALGDIGKKVHTGRSRNDQVATCIALYARYRLHAVAQSTLGLLEALGTQAADHAATPWIARTHGQPAQPATVAFLLHAHMTRFLSFAKDVVHALGQVNISPLGGGAIAGSTLPLDPAHTADLLGMTPAPNALAATGTRDTIVRAVDLAATGGALVADLAQDLLTPGGPAVLAARHTTGSSLMPHKRNPDALELLRGHGKALRGHAATVHAVTDGLGLGYMRDLQVTKPTLFALDTLQDLLDLAAEVIADATFHGTDLSDPGLLATDLAEALVLEGIPFRDAYAQVAKVYAAVEEGVPFAEAVRDLPLAVLPVQGDPSARQTLGAPGNLPDLGPAIQTAADSLQPFTHAIQTAEGLVTG